MAGGAGQGGPGGGAAVVGGQGGWLQEDPCHAAEEVQFTEDGRWDRVLRE